MIAPFEYVALPMAVMWGVVFFGDWPDSITYAGMALICGSGLYVVHRETVLAHARRTTDGKSD